MVKKKRKGAQGQELDEADATLQEAARLAWQLMLPMHSPPSRQSRMGRQGSTWACVHQPEVHQQAELWDRFSSGGTEEDFLVKALEEASREVRQQAEWVAYAGGGTVEVFLVRALEAALWKHCGDPAREAPDEAEDRGDEDWVTCRGSSDGGDYEEAEECAPEVPPLEE
eukprot:14032163-Heterocapsa_arctica.AAC.1